MLVISWQCLLVAYMVLPHWGAISQTFDMAPDPITCTLLLSSPQLDNRQLRYWNITFSCTLEWRNCIGVQLIEYSPLCSRRRYFSAKFITFYLILGVRWILNTGLGLSLVYVLYLYFDWNSSLTAVMQTVLECMVNYKVVCVCVCVCVCECVCVCWHIRICVTPSRWPV